MKRIIAIAAAVMAMALASGCDWEHHTNEWGDEWVALLSGEDSPTWGYISLRCPPDGGPEIWVRSDMATAVGRWTAVEYRVDDGPVVRDQWYASRGAHYTTWLQYYGNRWEFAEALSGGESLAFRWTDYWGIWHQLDFPDLTGADKAALYLDQQCRFLSDEPVRNGPSITPEDIDQSCVELAETYIEELQQKLQRVFVLDSAAYVEHSLLTGTAFKACEIALDYSHGADAGNIYLCWQDVEVDGRSAQKWAAVGGWSGLGKCLDDWREYHTPLIP